MSRPQAVGSEPVVDAWARLLFPTRLRRRTGGSEAVLCFFVEIGRQRSFLQNVEVRLQVGRVDRADDGRIQVRVREREAEYELHRRHAVEQVIERGAAPALPLQPRLFSFGWRPLCGAAANDDTCALLSSYGDCSFVFTFDCRVRDLKDVEDTH